MKQKISSFILTVLTAIFVLSAIVGLVFSCYYALILLFPAILTGAYPTYYISKKIINNFKPSQNK